MEVEITNLDFKLSNAVNDLSKYKETIFFDGMCKELEGIINIHKLVQKMYFEYAENKIKCHSLLDKIKNNLMDLGINMINQVAEWEIPHLPFDDIEYNKSCFNKKIDMLHEYNNYLAAIRETHALLLAKYFPLTILFKNEISNIYSLYIWSYKCQEIWKNCIYIRRNLDNLEKCLENVTKKAQLIDAENIKTEFESPPPPEKL